MNETVMRRPAFIPAAKVETGAEQTSSPSSALYGYGLLTISILLGWLLRERNLITPEYGVGYWLGIIGGSMMLLLLLYPMRKRIRFLHKLGSTRSWFRMHMILGLVGPLLVLYHCNFRLGSFNSRVALYCMLLVAGSGIIGRYLYARVHRGLYGRKTNLRELQRELAASAEKSHGMATIMPTLVKRLDRISDELQGDAITQSVGVGRALGWAVTHHLTRLSLLLTARRELKAAAARSPAISRNYKRIRRTTARYIRDYTMLFRRVAQFSFYERLLALWHIFHLPIFYMMVLSALIHVLAVHMY